MIFAICGKLGGGKSLSSVVAMVNHIKRGGFVVSNIRLNVDNISNHIRKSQSFVKAHYLLIDADNCNPQNFPHGDLRGTPNGRRVLVVIDESAEWFSSLDSSKQLKEWVSWLRHSDKLGTDIYFIVQDLSMLHKQGRLLINRMIVCIDMAKFKFPIICCQPFPWLNKYIRLIEHDAITQEVVSRTWLLKSKDIFSFYNTADLFGLSYFSNSQSAYASIAPRNISFKLKGPFLWLGILISLQFLLLVILVYFLVFWY
jgi:hypothetical protein